MNIEQQKDFEEMVKDIHAKMIDSELMEKYQLSAAELKTILNHLVETKVLTRVELYRRPILTDDRDRCRAQASFAQTPIGVLSLHL